MYLGLTATQTVEGITALPLFVIAISGGLRGLQFSL